MVVKAKTCSSDLSDFPIATFLKGIWLPAITGEYVWTRLPSMALKMFKTTKPIEHIVRRNKRDKVTLQQARTRYFHVIAQSLAPFTLPPGVHEFVIRWRPATPLFSRYKLDGRVEPGANRWLLDYHRSVQKLCTHYRCPPEVYHSWISLMRRVEPGEAHVHLMWMLLAQDY